MHSYIELGPNCKKIGSGATPRGGKESYLDDGPYTLVRSQNIHNDGFKFDGLAYIGQEQADKLSNVALEKNDVLLNITGDSVARACQVHQEALPGRVNQHVAIIRPKPEKIDTSYLRYWLIHPTTQDFLLGLSSAGATRKALTKGMIETLELPDVDIKTQKLIGSTLKLIDDKIEHNQQINETLEAMVQAIFKDWFVDFGPIRRKQAGETDPLKILGGLIPDPDKAEGLASLFSDSFSDNGLPEGWVENKVKEKIYVFTGHAFKSKDYVEEGIFVLRTKNFDRNNVASRSSNDVFLPEIFLKTHEKFIVQPFDYHLVMVGASIGKRGLVYPHLLPALRNQNMWCFRSKNTGKVSQVFVRHLVDFLVNRSMGLASGSARNFFRKGDFENQTFVLGNGLLQNAFEETCQPIMELCASNAAQSQTLAETRDYLLPRLISGEVKVTDLDEVA